MDATPIACHTPVVQVQDSVVVLKAGRTIRAFNGGAHIGEIERGESNVTLQSLKILADTLGCRIVDLVKGL